MKKRKTLCLLTAVPDTFHSQRICRGVATQCEKYGYDLAVFCAMINLDFFFEDYAQGERNIYELPDFKRFDGIIFDSISMSNGNQTKVMEKLYDKIKHQTEAPLVNVGMPFGDMDYIQNENDEPIRELCRHAIEVHGCRDICILTGEKGHHESEERLEIMLDEIHKHGLEVTEEHRVYGDFWYSSGNKLAQDIVSGKIKKPDAVIAASDHMALGFIEEYTKLGGHVPEDVVVLGFEGTSEALLDDISLTTVDSNFAKCAADAVDRLRSFIEPGKEIIPYAQDLGSMFHIGMSCGCTPCHSDTLNAIKANIYLVTRNYKPDVFDDDIDIGLLMESYIPERLTASTSPDECITNIYNTAYVISPFLNFYLCLRQDWLDTNADVTEGYPDKMDLVLLRSMSGRQDINVQEYRQTFKTELMLPQLFEETDEPSVYYFSAVHFADKTLGYAVLQRKLSDCRKFNLVYRNWLRFISNALEMARTRNRYVVLSIYDKMTGLLNRRGMYQELERLTTCKTVDKELFVSVIDMDGLKYINDTFGHSEGDHGIIRIADAVRAVAQENDICCRAGGDEFFIIGLRDKGAFDADKYADDFCGMLSKLSESDNKPYVVTASIGSALESENSDLDIEALIAEADENMYHYKLSRRRRREDRREGL
ncbi:MAG: GGDEF domain-containing protein [Eubacterium sp.]|nr:GGDEF domain-containing protein [Eubacterium sp.]